MATCIANVSSTCCPNVVMAASSCVAQCSPCAHMGPQSAPGRQAASLTKGALRACLQPVQLPHAWHRPQGNAHANHQLRSWNVHAGDALSHWVLHLQHSSPVQSEMTLMPINIWAAGVLLMLSAGCATTAAAAAPDPGCPTAAQAALPQLRVYATCSNPVVACLKPGVEGVLQQQVQPALRPILEL